ncbi:hypothetical protein STEG23_036669 [Scotinomys teguina]
MVVHDPLLCDLPIQVTLKEVNSQIALEYGQGLTVRVCKMDGEVMPVVVVQNATVLDLKKAIQRYMQLKQERERRHSAHQLVIRVADVCLMCSIGCPQTCYVAKDDPNFWFPYHYLPSPEISSVNHCIQYTTKFMKRRRKKKKEKEKKKEEKEKKEEKKKDKEKKEKKKKEKKEEEEEKEKGTDFVLTEP